MQKPVCFRDLSCLKSVDSQKSRGRDDWWVASVREELSRPRWKHPTFILAMAFPSLPTDCRDKQVLLTGFPGRPFLPLLLATLRVSGWCATLSP